MLGLSNRTFSEFVLDSTAREIYNAKCEYSSGSKANRLRGFWNEEPNVIVAKLIGDLLDYMMEAPLFDAPSMATNNCVVLSSPVDGSITVSVVPA